MPNETEDFMTLYKAGKIKEALAWVEERKAKLKYAPDKVTISKGKARFTRKGKTVEQDANGTWRLKEKK